MEWNGGDCKLIACCDDKDAREGKLAGAGPARLGASWAFEKLVHVDIMLGSNQA